MPISVQVFLLEQTATSLPDLFRALHDLEYITDQPGPSWPGFSLGRLGKREKASLEEFAGLRGTQAGLNLRALSFEQIVVLPPGIRSILSLVCRSAMSGLT